MSRILGTGKCSRDLFLIDDEDEHLQQERQPADGRGREMRAELAHGALQGSSERVVAACKTLA